MPLSSNPAARAKFWLDTDADVPLATRAVFLIRFMTTAELQRHQSLMEQVAQAADDHAAYVLAREALGVGVVNWQNLSYPTGHEKAGQAMPFDLDLLFSSKVLTEQELWSLARLYPVAVRPVEMDLKNFGSQVVSGQEQLAPSANPPA